MRQRALSLLSAFALVLFASEAQSRDGVWQLVCFRKADLEKSLNGVVNAQQFLRNDRLLKRGGCDFVQIPSGSTARFAGFFQSRNGFIYPTFQVRYATTGQRMYGADGIFLSSGWRVSRKLRECAESGFRDVCLVPRDCGTLDGFVTTRSLPAYVAVPSSCQTFRIE